MNIQKNRFQVEVYVMLLFLSPILLALIALALFTAYMYFFQ